MVPVVAGGVVALGPHALDVEVWTPALEGLCAGFDAPHGVVAGQEGAIGESLAWFDFCGYAVVDY